MIRLEIMEEIQYMEKPDWVSWDDVRICLNAAHQVNKKGGFEMLNATITTDALTEMVKDARCFVALDGKKVVGIACVKILNMKKWFVRDQVLYTFCDGILPEYRGTDVYFGLRKVREAYVKSTGIKIHMFRTSEHNKVVIKLNKKRGFKLVQFHPTPKKIANYYNVTMVKWDDGCPFPDWFLNFMFKLSKIVSKTFFKRN